MQQSLTCCEKAIRLSKEADDPYSIANANWASSVCKLLFTEKAEEALNHARTMMKQGELTRDNYLKGIASYLLTFVQDWMIKREGDPEKKKKGHEKIIKHARNAIKYLEPIHQDFFIAGTYLFYTETHSSLAREFTPGLDEKRAILKQAVEAGRSGLKHATKSGSPDATGSNLHALSKALHFYSNIETAQTRKKKLLEEALMHRQMYIDVAERSFSTNNWIKGVGRSYEGLVRVDLARVEKDKANRKTLFEKAVLSMEEGITFSRRWILSHPNPTLMAVVARYEDGFAAILKELYLLTDDAELLARANEALSEAASKFKRVRLSSRVAECYWKIANNLDYIGRNEQSGENFEKAYGEYKAAAREIPNFADFYSDYAAYMKAWSEIEKAKHAHKKREYSTSYEHYQKTSNILEESKQWNYLAPNFLAWALLEKAEDYSRREANTESTESFKESIKTLRKAKHTLQTQSEKIDNADEKQLAETLIKASDMRQKYCLGRIAVEEAKILDRQGDHTSSSAKYGSAAETFKGIVGKEFEQATSEVKPLIYLCQAWQKMMMAEAKASPSLFGEAAELFQEVKKHTTDQSTSLMTLAHSSFCKALGAGTEFEISMDMKDYTTATKHMETAANYYLRAGFKGASAYAKATQRLFEAYVHLNNAKTEMNPETQAKYYAMAEKILEISAGYYVEARHPEKTKQVRQLLQEVREDRELAVSLGEVLHAPTITSSTTSFMTLTPHEETAVGLERFERADIQAKLVPHEQEIRSGEGFDLEIQIMNVGKEAVLLSKIEQVTPVGFEITAMPDYCYFEDGTLDMKGKRLDPLKTEEIKLAVKTFGKGVFEISPRILCVDEHGNNILRGPDPITVTVQETVLPGRLTTGYAGLDNLLFGGIPEGYSVVLTSPSCDERDVLIRKFLEAGVREKQTTLYVTIETSGMADLIEKSQSRLQLFVCNPRANAMIKDLPNVHKLKGVENLTDIEIALVSTFRQLGPQTGPRRACIAIVSDILLQHHAITTRKWLAGLIPELRSKGFTTVAVMNPLMHSSEEVHAIIGLFEGEISIYEKETARGIEKSLRVKKMISQKYLRSEIALSMETMET
jgi:KaiC/GvpD/RAD55 family RecA-like ATPase/tetratricopeptide (TPR) repeat protein